MRVRRAEREYFSCGLLKRSASHCHPPPALLNETNFVDFNPNDIEASMKNPDDSMLLSPRPKKRARALRIHPRSGAMKTGSLGAVRPLRA